MLGEMEGKRTMHVKDALARIAKKKKTRRKKGNPPRKARAERALREEKRGTFKRGEGSSSQKGDIARSGRGILPCRRGRFVASKKT